MRKYLNTLTASVNKKGVLDIDTVKGCSCGMQKYHNGCYGVCYANGAAKARGYDFSKTVFRNDFRNAQKIINMLKKHKLEWFRIGTMGDPCHNWGLTLRICKELYEYRIPVIITKHWKKIPNERMDELIKYNVIVNTSISPLDSIDEIDYRLKMFLKLKKSGVKSVLRIVSCKFGDTENGRRLSMVQDELFKHSPIIDNPLRIPKSNPSVLSGDIITEKLYDLGSEVYISYKNKSTYLGHCGKCPDQCGVTFFK
jgi:hypothetical protein